MKPVAFYDTECFPNYWLLKFKTQKVICGGDPISFELEAGGRFSPRALLR